MRKWEGWVVLSQEKLEFRMISASVSPFREQDGFKHFISGLDPNPAPDVDHCP